MKKFLLLFVFTAITAAVALAADPPGFGSTGSPDPIPVDGGASLLVAAGIGYGAKQLRAKRAAKKA
jgi:hypothetical protein